MPSQLTHPASLYALCVRIWRHRQLVAQLVRRDVVGRYKGSLMGIAWSFLHPLLMLAVYSFVFRHVFNARWPAPADDGRDVMAAAIFIGMIVHGLFAECMNRAPSLVVANPNFVRKVIFPLEMLPVVALASALFHALMSVAVLVGFCVIGGYFEWRVLLLPLALLPLCAMALGVAWLLAATGVFLRDIAQATGILSTVLLFLSPVFYPVSALPPAYRAWFELNPLTPVIEHARHLALEGAGFEWQSWAVQCALGLAVAWFGLWWFQRTRKGFADVM